MAERSAGAQQIVARERPRPRWFWVGPILGLVGVSAATVNMALGRWGQVLFVILFAVLLTVAVIDLLLPADRKQAVVTDDVLRVGRWGRVSTIARNDVRAVHGDVLGRPTWSDRVVVEHVGGELRLPLYAEPPSEVIGRLQEWAGVGERPGDPPPQSANT